MIKKNEGNTDRVIRVVLGLVLLAVAYVQGITWLYVVGGLAVFTGLSGFCFLYTLLGINTCPKK